MYFSREKSSLYWEHENLGDKIPEIRNYLKTHYNYEGCFYLYNLSVLKKRCQFLIDSLPDSFFYFSVKSLSNIRILKEIGLYAQFGMDIVSGGELQRAIRANIHPSRIVFAGVSKSRQEIETAQKLGIRAFHVESFDELKLISEIAKMNNQTAPITIRLNPNVDVKTHKNITTGKDENKFGISIIELKEICAFMSKNLSLKLIGLQAHIGSQILDAKPYIQTLEVLSKATKQNDLDLEYVSLGGGFGIDYSAVYLQQKAHEFPFYDLADAIKSMPDFPYRLHFEPGRFLTAHAGILVSKVQFIKPKSTHSIALLDTGMSELMRTALYSARHTALLLEEKKSAQQSVYELAGPICESTDVFGRYSFPIIEKGDTIIFTHAGAYGAVMASNYNTRPLVPEVLIENGHIKIIRRPQSIDEIFCQEQYET